MKKKIMITILSIIIILTLCLKFIPFGTRKNIGPNSSVYLTVPKLSIFTEECCMFSSSFKSFSSTFTLQYELDNIMNKYEKYQCNNKTLYYDKINDITISEYGVEFRFPFNNF